MCVHAFSVTETENIRAAASAQLRTLMIPRKQSLKRPLCPENQPYTSGRSRVERRKSKWQILAEECFFMLFWSTYL